MELHEGTFNGGNSQFTFCMFKSHDFKYEMEENPKKIKRKKKIYLFFSVAK